MLPVLVSPRLQGLARFAPSAPGVPRRGAGPGAESVDALALRAMAAGEGDELIGDLSYELGVALATGCRGRRDRGRLPPLLGRDDE
jgi:hypothetical protein